MRNQILFSQCRHYHNGNIMNVSTASNGDDSSISEHFRFYGVYYDDAEDTSFQLGATTQYFLATTTYRRLVHL